MDAKSRNVKNNENTPSIVRKRKSKPTDLKKVSFAIQSPEVKFFDKSNTRSPSPLKRSSFSSSNPLSPKRSPFSSSNSSAAPQLSPSRLSSAFNSSLSMDKEFTNKRTRHSIGGFNSSLQLPKPHPSASTNSRFSGLSPGKVDGKIINSTFTYYPLTPVNFKRSSSFRSLNYNFYKPS